MPAVITLNPTIRPSSPPFYDVEKAQFINLSEVDKLAQDLESRVKGVQEKAKEGQEWISLNRGTISFTAGIAAGALVLSSATLFFVASIAVSAVIATAALVTAVAAGTLMYKFLGS